MKPLLKWLGLAAVMMTAAVGAQHLFFSENPQRIVVVVDSSHPMAADWARLPGVFADITQERYAVYALTTEKGQIHSWQGNLDLSGVNAYAPRDFSRLEAISALPEVHEADEVVFVTNTANPGIPDNWRIMNPR